MRHALLLALLLAAVPLASAQVPEPDALVTTACATVAGVDRDVRDAIPLCPQEEPAGPADPTEEEHQHGAEPGPQEPAEQAQDLGRQARETVEESAADPERAPERIVAFLATVRQFVVDLIGLPGAMLDSLGGALSLGASSSIDAMRDARDASIGFFDMIRDILQRHVNANSTSAPPAVEDSPGEFLPTIELVERVGTLIP